MKTLLHAAWLADMTGPAIGDAAVVFDAGRIIGAGDFRAMQASHPDASITDLGKSIILPGLINAHTHLELSACAPGEAAPERFIDWILSLSDRRKLGDRTSEQAAAAATARGIGQCLRFGVTAVGDIAQNAQAVRAVLRDGPVRSVSFGEAVGLGKSKPKFEQRLQAALDESAASQRMRIGLSPHAPYSLDLESWRRCMRLAAEKHLPITTHLAETTHEEEFLKNHTGDFRELLDRLGLWEESIQTLPAGPVPFAKAMGLLDQPSLLAHVNYCDDDGLALLAAGQASVVFCPRTHAYFRHPPHRWRDMLARGVNVCVGTDSGASSPDLNPVDDLRLLHRQSPQVPAIELWQLATTRAAKALGMSHLVGTLTPGKLADFVVFKAAGNDPLADLLEGDALPTRVYIAGENQSTSMASP